MRHFDLLVGGLSGMVRIMSNFWKQNILLRIKMINGWIISTLSRRIRLYPFPKSTEGIRAWN